MYWRTAESLGGSPEQMKTRAESKLSLDSEVGRYRGDSKHLQLGTPMHVEIGSGYVRTYAELVVLPARVQNDDGSMTRAVVFGLSDGTYKVRVAAANAHGAGPWSTEAYVTLPAE